MTRRQLFGLRLGITWLAAATLVSANARVAAASDASGAPGVVARGGERALTFGPTDGSRAWLLTVADAKGVRAVRVVRPGGRVVFDLVGDDGVPLPDGEYVYRLRALVNDGAGAPPARAGRFAVAGGHVVMPAAGEAAAGASPDYVINDDLIGMGSFCIGFDCVNGETFGADTIRLKENNLRIHFDDTSTAGSYPRNDWAIEVNSQNNGGASYFAVQDRTSGRYAFRIDAGAPADALRVDSGGDLGIRTANPVLDVHARANDSPGVRLEQDSSAGYAPQTWDIAANESNFFVRDVTNGSHLPFRIRPGAPSNSLYVAASGNVGVNTSSPSEKLHVNGGTRLDGTLTFSSGAAPATPATGTMTVFYQTAETLRFKFDDGSQPFRVVPGTLPSGGGAAVDGVLRFLWSTGAPTPGVGAAFTWLDSSDGSLRFRFANGTTAQLTNAGVWTDASSRAFKHDIRPLASDDALAALDGLAPVRYFYNGNPDEHLGFIAEDVPDLVATDGRQGLAPMDIVAVLTKVVQQQQAQLERLAAEVAALKSALGRPQTGGR